MKVEVLLPVRDPNPTWLLECLRSLAEQVQVKPTVVLVLHPNSASCVQIIKQVDVEIDLVWAPEHGNIADALNKGLENTSGTYVARIDADDVAEPHRLAVQVERMDMDPDLMALGTAVTTINAGGEKLEAWSNPTSPRRTFSTLRWRNALFHPSVMMRRSAVAEVGGYRPESAGAEDYDLWLRLSVLGSLYSLSEPLTRYRIHGDQISRRHGLAPSVVNAVGESRRALASAKGESPSCAVARQFLWGIRQRARRLNRT